jgi:nucleotide-binding universal stress UspA family protein
MDREQKILFGVDNSLFSRDAVATTGILLKDKENLKITLFHSILEPKIPFLEKLRLSPETLESYLELWSIEEQMAVQRSRKAMIDGGFDPAKVEAVYEEKCKDPAISLLNHANREGFDTIALARWGDTIPEQQSMGTITYKLISMAYYLSVWTIDPRISYRDVLVTIVGADISRRVTDHAIRYFAHLKDSRFTLFHVIPPVPPQLHTSSYWDYVRDMSGEDRQEEMARRMKDYSDTVEKIAEEGKARLIEAGIPEQNVVIKSQAQREGIARDILVELEEGHYGILVIGRKGFRNISQFGLGSKANKLLHAARTFVTSLVN